MPLNHKQAAFCHEYLIDFNGKQSAIRAGYAPKNAEITASKLLRLPKVERVIKELNKKREERTLITADMVIKELSLIAFQDSANLVDENDSFKTIHNMGTNISRTVAEVTSRVERSSDGDVSEIIKVKTYDKKGALDSLGKHFGIFEKDNSQQTNEILIINAPKP